LIPKTMERSLLSSNHPEKQFDVKLPMAGKAFALVCLFALSTQFAVAQNKIAVNALPTGGKVVAGAATISSTSTATSATMNINQTSQRAVINWQTFNVGKNATVNFNQPNSNSVTLNRVVSATPSMIQGAVNANGQVILVNPNGVTFGKGAEVNAAGVVASTLNISNQDFMNGKNVYSGNGEGKIVNKGTITATDPNGYIALLAPEIRNQGYLIARMGPSSSVALASGEKISLDFRGTQLIGVSIDKAAYKALIENKRIIETNGGLIVVAAGTARELMSSVIQNTGRISANAIVDNGGVIELVADNVTNSGTISANGGTNGVGGQVNIVGNNITLAANSKTTATGNEGGGSIQVGVGKTMATNTTPVSAVTGNTNTLAAPQTAAQILASNTQGVGNQAQTVNVEQGALVDASAINSGNGGAIVIWSQVKTSVNGILKAVGGYLNGNGGLVETSSAGLVSLGKSLSINTSSTKGNAGLWYVDPIDLTIDGASSAVISAALVNNNVSITVAGNVCPSLGSCTQNGSGNLTIANGADIIKQSGSLTTLTLTASGIFNLNANISGQNLDVIINSSIAYLNAGSTITANQVTVQAQTIYSYGNINSGSLSNLGSAIQLLGSALYISGNLTVGANLANSSNSTNSNSNTVSYNGTLIRHEDLPTYLLAANQTTLNLDQVYGTTAANQSSFITAVNNQITLTGTQSISIAATAQLLANGTTGGVIMATAPQINFVTSSNSSPSSGSQSIQGNGSLIQANGNNGPGGTISLTAANDFNINSATISASGSTDGGSIHLISSSGNLLLANSLIQTNGGTGRGGSLGVSGANSTTINSSTLEATGFSKGGSVMVGYDSAGKSIPFSQSTTIDAATILNANQTDATNTTGGGLIETSGGTLTQLASINAGRGGMWLLDPYSYTIDAAAASLIDQVLNNQISVTISTSAASSSPDLSSNQAYGIQPVRSSGTAGTITIISDIIMSPQNGGAPSILTLDAGGQNIYLSANISTTGGATFNGPVILAAGAVVNLSSKSGSFTFNYSLDSATPSNLAQLVINTGGYAIFKGNVGGNVSLTNLSVTAGGINIYGNIFVFGQPALTGTSASILLSGPVSLYGTSNINAGRGDVLILDSVTSGYGVSSPTNLFVQAGLNGSTSSQIYFGNTITITGILSATAGTIYLGSSVTTSGSQTYTGNLDVLTPSTQIITNGGDLSITGVLSGSYLANSPIFLYTNGYYYDSISNQTHQLYIGQTVNLVGGALTYISGTASQTSYSWTPKYDAVGSVLAVGGGSGGNSGSVGGVGGNGGSVVTNRMVEFAPNSTYTLNVGFGGNGGASYGSNGGDTTISLGSTNWITASGGYCCSSAGNGGANQPIANPPYGYVPGSGVQAFGLVGLANSTGVVPGFTSTSAYYSGSTQYTTVNNGGNGTYFGSGGSYGSTSSNLAGLPGDTNTGMGGGGGAHLANGMLSAGGAGGSGVLMFNQVTSAATDLTISTGVGKVTINGVNGSSHGTIDGYSGNTGSSLNSLAISSGNSASRINGSITGGIDLTYSGLQSNGTYGSLTLFGNNTYSGNTNVLNGYLIAGSESSLVTKGYSNINVSNGNATLDLNGFSLANIVVISIMGKGVNDQGALINSNTNSTASFDGKLYSGLPAYIGGPGSILIKGQVQAVFGIAFVNGASVAATNPNNLDLTIAGLNAGTISLATGGVFTVGTVGSLSGFTGTPTGSINLYAPGNGILINQSIIAKSIYIYGNGTFVNPGNIGVEIESATLHATTGGITIYGVGTYTSAGIMIGGSSVLITDVGSISLSGLAPRLGIVFGGFGGSGGRSPTGATTTSPLTLDSAQDITLAGYASMSSGSPNIFGISLNSALPGGTPQYSLLKASGNITLAGSTPNCACFGVGDFGAAISVQNTPISAGSQITFEGAGTQLISWAMTGAINGSQGGLPVSGSLAVASAVPFTAANPSFADGYQQAYGVYLSNSMAVTYGGKTYYNTTAVGQIAIYGSSYSGLGFSGDSDITSTTGSLTIWTNGDGNANTGGIYIGGTIYKQGAEAAPIYIASTSNVSVGNINDTASAPIQITGGYGIAAGDTSGGTITHLGTISARGPVELSMASAPTNTCTVSSCPIAGAVGITSANANIATNILYGVDGGIFTTTPSGYTGGNFIEYRQLPAVTYNVTLANNYQAVYGTAYNSSDANAWLLSNANVTLSGTAFGYIQSAAAANLRFSSSIYGSLSSNTAQNATPMTSSSLFSTDHALINLSGSPTYTILPAPLGISVTGVYNGTTTFTPTSFTLANPLAYSDTLSSLSSATFAFGTVLNPNNYVTSITPGGSSTINMSNYTLNALGRNASSGSLQNIATVTPATLTVSPTAVVTPKFYDGNVTATITGAALVGVVAADQANAVGNGGVQQVTLTMNAGSFASQNAGNGIAVTPVGALTGNSASNYNLVLPTNLTGNILPKPLNLSATKVYDGTTSLNGAINFNGSLVGTETLGYVANASSLNASTNLYISSLTLSNGANGGLVSNYLMPTLTSRYTYNNVSITPAPLGISVTGTYNGSTVISPLFNVYGLAPGDSISSISSATLAFKDVSQNASNFVRSIVVTTGNFNSSNYALNPIWNNTPNSNLNNTASLNPMNVSLINTTAANKVYDGTAAANISAALAGVVSGDSVTLQMSGNFVSTNVGTHITVNPTGTLTGPQASNYNLLNYVPGGLYANITPSPLGISISVTYNGNTTFTNPNFGAAGMVNGETITSLGQVTLANANVSANGSNYVTSYTISGGTASASNYIINPGYYGTPGPTNNMATINARVLTVSASKVYDGTTSLAGAVTLGNLVTGQTLNYTAVGFSPNVGTAGNYINSLTISDGSGGGLASNYTTLPTSAVTAPLTITPKPISLVGYKVYDGTTSMNGSITISGLVSGEALNYTASANSPNVVGTTYISAISLSDSANGLASNYSLPSLSGTSGSNIATITPKAVNLSASKVYDGTVDLTGAVTINGLVAGQTLAYSGATANSANVNTVSNTGATYINAITLANATDGSGGIASNYLAPSLLGQNTFNNAAVTPKLLTFNVGAVSKVYDGTTTITNPITFGGLIGNQTLSYSSANAYSALVSTANNFISSITLTNGSNGGIVTNYALPPLNATNAPITITTRPLVITVSAQSKVYGDGIATTSNSTDGTNTGTQNVTYTNGVATASYQGFQVSGLVTGDSVTTVTLTSAGAALTANAASGTSAYPITASNAVGMGLNNYSIQYVNNAYSVMTVTPRPLYVTVGNATMAYGSTVLPNFTSTVTGLVNGDQAAANLSTTATIYNGAAGSGSNVGTYAITAATSNNANYTVVPTNGTLTVTPVNLTITANTQGGPGSPILYGTPTVLSQSSSALTASGLVNGDFVSGATITFNNGQTNSQTVAGTTSAGTYNGALNISAATGSGLTNYVINYQPGNLIIGKALLTVTAANDAKLQGQADNVGIYNGLIYSGFKNGDGPTSVDQTNLLITRSNGVVETVGNYAGVLQVSGLSAANYSISYGSGNYTIVGPGQLLVKLAPALTQYGSTITYGTPSASYIPISIFNPGAASAVVLTASINPSSPNVVNVTDGTPGNTIAVPLTVANSVNSTSGNLAVGAYNLSSTPQTVNVSGTTFQFTSAATVGGLTVTPKAISFADLNFATVTKVYDGSSSLSNLSINPNPGVLKTGDLVSMIGSGSYTDKNVGTGKTYTAGVVLNGADASNYVLTGGGIYIADGQTIDGHGAANGIITQLNSVTYVGSAAGGAWSDPNSWRVTTGTTLGAIPDLANVANVVIGAGNTVIYDSGVQGPVQTAVANSGNINFSPTSPLNVQMNIAGSGTITIGGSAIVTLSGNNSYAGNTIINNGASLIAGSTNALGAGNLQGSGGSFGVKAGVVLPVITATGSLNLISDITTSGNQTYNNVIIATPPSNGASTSVTTLTSQLGNIIFGGTLDGSVSKTNSLLVLTPNGSTTFSKSVGSIMPLNVLEVDSLTTNINADILTSNQQNYCGVTGCYATLTPTQISNNYCTSNDCYSHNLATLSYDLLAGGTGGSASYALVPNSGQVVIGDNGTVGFLYGTYRSDSLGVGVTPAALFQNNTIYARTLISMDPLVNLGGAVNDASPNAIHTLQVAAIKVQNANSPSIQYGGSIGRVNPLYSLNTLTETIISNVAALDGSTKVGNGITITTQSSMSYASKTITAENANFVTVDKTASISFIYPPNTGSFSDVGGSIHSNYVYSNGSLIRSLAGVTFVTALSGGIPAPNVATPTLAPTRNSFILAAVTEQTRINHKYDVDASVDVGEIETDSGPAANDDQADEKKKNQAKKAAQ